MEEFVLQQGGVSRGIKPLIRNRFTKKGDYMQTNLDLFAPKRVIRFAPNPYELEYYEKLIDDTKFSVWGVGFFKTKTDAKRFVAKQYLNDKISKKAFKKYYAKVRDKKCSY